MAVPDERQKPVTDDIDDDIHEVQSHTPDFRTELAEELARIAPEAVADGKIDVEKLRELLDEDAANDGRERFGLMWPGKSRALEAAQASTTATLVPDREASKDWDTSQNLFIEGDNLEVLKILQKHYHGKIKLIYIDPPYNTGGDFIYPDNYKEGLKTYLQWTKQVSEDGQKLSSNPETAGRYHSNWLNMMYPRLKLARNLLKEDGVLLVHIDEHEFSHLEQLVSDIFGRRNYLGAIVWDKRNPKGDSRGISQQHEYIVLAAKDAVVLEEQGGIMRPKKRATDILMAASKIVAANGGVSEKTRAEFKSWIGGQDLSGGEAAYNLLDEDGDVYRTVSMAWPNRKRAPEEYFQPLVHPVSGEECPVPARGWRNPPDTMRRLLAENRIVFGQDHTTQPTRKYLLRENLFERVPSLLYFGGNDDARLRELGVDFPNPKPVELISSLVESFAGGEDLILDFFAGSCSTAHAVMMLNARDGNSRRFIQVQLPEPVQPYSEPLSDLFESISSLGIERIRRAGEKVKEELAERLSTRETPLDIGFRTYKLADTSFVKWRETSGTDQNALEERLAGLRGSADDDATPEMLLTELLLKQGYSLTESISEIEIAGLKVWSVAEGAMLAIMDEHVKPSLAQLRAVVESGPVRLVILEDVFAGDDELKTNLVQHAKTHGVELWSA